MSHDRACRALTAQKSGALDRGAGDIIAIVQQWIDQQAGHFPGFAGAYLFGSIIHQPPEKPFPAYRDVDLVIVLAEGNPLPEITEIFYAGVMIEVAYQSMERLESPARVLSDPELATNVATTRILADPLGVLAPFQQEVAKQFSRREWLQARCVAEMQFVQQGLQEMANAGSLFEKTLGFWNTCSCLSGLVALSCLHPPTHRRSLVQSQILLAGHGQFELQEEMLSLWGAEALTSADVQGLLVQAIQMFDRSVEIHKTPVPYDFKLKPHLRPCFWEAAQEMIDEGFYRESTFWIALPISIGYLAIMADGSESDRQVAAGHYETFWKALHLRTAEEVDARVKYAHQVTRHVEQFAERMIDHYGT